MKNLVKKPEVKELIREFLEFRPKYQGGYLNSFDVDYEVFCSQYLSEKEKRMEKEMEELADRLQQLLPDQKVSPSNVNIRSNKKDVIKKLNDFFKTYKKIYSKEIIEKAVKQYGENAMSRNFERVSPLHYALLKDGTSIIASLCEEVMKKPVTTNKAISEWI